MRVCENRIGVVKNVNGTPSWPTAALACGQTLSRAVEGVAGDVGRSPGVLGMVLAAAGGERERLRKFPFPASGGVGRLWLLLLPSATHALERLASAR